MYGAARVVDELSAAWGGPRAEAMLLARHHLIDRALERAIASGAVGQVVEIAAGLSPRGLRLSRRFEGIRIIEGDLPAMCENKRERLRSAGLDTERHHVVSVNALADLGEDSLASVTGELLDRSEGTAIVTEGLIPYFDPRTVESMWRRFSRVLRDYPRGLYVTDLYTEENIGEIPGARIALAAVAAFARGAVHLHFDTAEEAAEAARGAGFDRAAIRDRRAISDMRLPRGGGRARVLEAWVNPPDP